jgi:trehalose synthase
LESYRDIIGDEKVRDIKILGEKICGTRVCHINATSFGGGVAEILQRLVPLMRDIGLDAEWKVIKGADEFFSVTKTIHNGLQGMSVDFSEDMKHVYLRYNKMNSELLSLDADFVVVHDPQPAAILDYCHKKLGRWIWRCHIDLSRPSPIVWSFLKPFVERYDAAIFSMRQYVREDLKIDKIAIVPPSIDPLSDKNKLLSEDAINAVLEKYGVDPERPIITQVSRFDPWKDPVGVIDVYRIVRRTVPEVQLLLVASMARDDPEGWGYYEKTARHAGEDYDIHLLSDLVGVGNLEVNAFQRASDVVLQKSIREGFGLTVTEALWKGVPVVGGNVGGIPLQVIDGVNGFLVDTLDGAAEKTIYLLKHPEEARRMGQAGRAYVLQNFLITRHLRDYLELLLQLSHPN